MYNIHSALFIDLYELIVAQAYFLESKNGLASFEVSVRSLPNNWGFFVMAGMGEFEQYLSGMRFHRDDIDYLRSTGFFFENFLSFLAEFSPEVSVRSIPEGTVFFPLEPVLEVQGPLITTQLLESYILNILGFSIIEASLATRFVLAASGISLIDFGLRRAQGPIASLRAARGARIAGFAATSNVFAARYLDMQPSGTMTHSYIQVHENEEDAFSTIAGISKENAVFLVDTYNTKEGIKTAAKVAQRKAKEKVRVKGVRIDSGDLAALSMFARNHFDEKGVGFLKIIVSGGLDEYQIRKLVNQKAPIDGFGVGTSFATSFHAPALDIIYKLVEYNGKPTKKYSPHKETYPGRKSLRRITINGAYREDRVEPLGAFKDDILKPFSAAEPLDSIKNRLVNELKFLDKKIKEIESPASYPVTFSSDITL